MNSLRQVILTYSNYFSQNIQLSVLHVVGVQQMFVELLKNYKFQLWFKNNCYNVSVWDFYVLKSRRKLEQEKILIKSVKSWPPCI